MNKKLVKLIKPVVQTRAPQVELYGSELKPAINGAPGKHKNK